MPAAPPKIEVDFMTSLYDLLFDIRVRAYIAAFESNGTASQKLNLGFWMYSCDMLAISATLYDRPLVKFCRVRGQLPAQIGNTRSRFKALERLHNLAVPNL
jgi:hypothetical protein